MILADLGWEAVATLGSPPLHRLWANADDDVWLVGGYPYPIDPGFTPYPDPEAESRLVHFDGTTATEIPSPSNTILDGVWGVSGDDVWVADGDDVIFHYDGTGWSNVDTLEWLGGAIDGVASDDVWFGGRTFKHWNGATMEEFSSPCLDYVSAIAAISSDDVWAACGTGTLVHWDGTEWSAVPTVSQLWVLGLFASASNDVWGVGNGGNRVHWDGAELSERSEGYVTYEALDGTSASDIWAVGSCCWDVSMAPLVAHFDGSSWTDHRVRDFDGGLSDIAKTPTGRFYALGWDDPPAHPVEEFWPVNSKIFVLRP
jgi:hypothetical protein